MQCLTGTCMLKHISLHKITSFRGDTQGKTITMNKSLIYVAVAVAIFSLCSAKFQGKY